MERADSDARRSKEDIRGPLEDETRLEIDSVVCGVGSTRVSGYELKDVVCYATTRVGGGYEWFYEIDIDSLDIHRRGF